jgi:hypothetical protein
LAQGETFHDFLSGEYSVKYLEINDRMLTDDDVILTFHNIYPWLLKSVPFLGMMKLNVKKINSGIRNSYALFPDEVIKFVV